ncbi:Bifunctional phosphatase IMPL2, chloroplastic [Auxenochlorella protothecoides]|nr:Bifunctional phosphatase IMPL2, chloroplastic [Auxenochlorella protothecoides]KFM27711.1 Bifunctional phosphatase IMPL2, chloroplastic [Auxenochlorella protothecoides]
MTPAIGTQDLEPFVALANRLADSAGAVSSRYFRTPVAVDVKADASPVTIADREAEGAMRDLLSTHAPTHGVFGEEFGHASGSDPDWTWVLDPIDGTKSFITGRPLFGTLIALTHRGVPVLGVLDQPILRERWVGVLGAETSLNGLPIHTRPCASVGDAYLFATTPHMFSGPNAEAFARVRDASRIPQYGCDCYAYGLVARGLADVVVEADLKPYDFLALVPILEGAGGVMTDWMGEALRLDPETITEAHEVVAAGDARTHAQALELLDWRR